MLATRRLAILVFCTVSALCLFFFTKRSVYEPRLGMNLHQYRNDLTAKNSYENRLEGKDRSLEIITSQFEKDDKIQQGRIGLKEEDRGRLQRQTLTPRQNLLIVSPGRGGSSFLGSMFNNNPNVMYCYEPLFAVASKFKFKHNLVRPLVEPMRYLDNSLKVIDSFFRCDFCNIDKLTMQNFKNSRFHLHHSKALRKENLPKLSKSSLKGVCYSYNHTVLKILSDRLPHESILSLKDLFEQESYDVKMLHLIRDPRAVVYSRVALGWLNPSDAQFVENVRRICDPILRNLRLGLMSPPPWLKNRFKVIRYEDLFFNTDYAVRELHRYAGLDWSARVDQWITSLATSPMERGPYSLHKNASASVNEWKKGPAPLTRAVEYICSDLINFAGYDR